MRNTLQSATLAILATFLLYSQALGQAPVLTYGNNNTIDLVENQANQRVDFYVSNIAGMGFDTFDLFIQIGDGGTLFGGSDTGPVLSNVELGNPGTLFEGGVRAPADSTTQTPLLWADGIDNVEVTMDGILGTLIFDTTGFFAGTSIGIQFEGITIPGNANSFDTFFTDQSVLVPVPVSSASNGIIRVIAVPEPASAIVILAVAGIVGVRRRR